MLRLQMYRFENAIVHNYILLKGIFFTYVMWLDAKKPKHLDLIYKIL